MKRDFVHQVGLVRRESQPVGEAAQEAHGSILRRDRQHGLNRRRRRARTLRARPRAAFVRRRSGCSTARGDCSPTCPIRLRRSRRGAGAGARGRGSSRRPEARRATALGRVGRCRIRGWGRGRACGGRGGRACRGGARRVRSCHGRASIDRRWKMWERRRELSSPIDRRWEALGKLASPCGNTNTSAGLPERLLIPCHAAATANRGEDVIRDEMLGHAGARGGELLGLDGEDGPRARGLDHIIEQAQ